jgi:hypothetical protein
VEGAAERAAEGAAERAAERAAESFQKLIRDEIAKQTSV